MSLMEVMSEWLQEEMSYDPRERNFYRDYYKDDHSKTMRFLRSKAIDIGKRDDRVHAKKHKECDRIDESKFHLAEVMQYMRLMTQEMATVMPLTRRRSIA